MEIDALTIFFIVAFGLIYIPAMQFIKHKQNLHTLVTTRDTIVSIVDIAKTIQEIENRPYRHPPCRHQRRRMEPKLSGTLNL